MLSELLLCTLIGLSGSASSPVEMPEIADVGGSFPAEINIPAGLGLLLKFKHLSGGRYFFLNCSVVD